MKNVKVIAGVVGIEWTDENGVVRTGTKEASDGVFSVDDKTAERLVAKGTVEYVGYTAPAPAEEPAEAADESDEEDLAALPNSALKVMIEELGGDTRNCRNKTQLIELLEELRAEADEEEPPCVSAADPE